MTPELDQLCDLLLRKGLKIATAESCTGGLVAKWLTDLSGSSDWFERGFVTYSNESKQEMLGISEETIAVYGAVSEQTVRAMAKGALANSHADISLAISGIAGPTGGTAEKPVGTVWFGLADRRGQDQAIVMRFDGDRASIRRQAAEFSIRRVLDMLQMDEPVKHVRTVRRLFFALWPDNKVREQLRGISQSHRIEKSRPIRPENLHITLNFLGNVQEHKLVDLLGAASGVQGHRFMLELTKLEVWRRSAVLALCSEETPDALLQLHSQLDQQLVDVGFETEKRKYRPHVTLARKTRQKIEPVSIEPRIEWTVDRFVLVESVPVSGGVRYDVLEQWPLT